MAKKKKKEPEPEFSMKYLGYLFEKREKYKEQSQKKEEKKYPIMSGAEFFEIFIVFIVINIIGMIFSVKGNLLYKLEVYIFVITPLSFVLSVISYLGYRELTNYNIYKELAVKKTTPLLLFVLFLILLIVLVAMKNLGIFELLFLKLQIFFSGS